MSPSLSIYSVLVAQVSDKSISIPITLRENQKNKQTVELTALLDSGAGGLFIDEEFAKKNGFTLYELPEPLNAYNIDGTKNKKGTITTYVEIDLQVGERTMKTRLFVTGLGRQDVILGFPWLRDENPIINWQNGEIRWRKDEQRKLGAKAIEVTRARLARERQQRQPTIGEEDDEEDRTRYPIPEWYPPDTIIITAEEQKAFENYARKLLADPRSKIHKTMKRLAAQVNHTEIDIGQVDMDDNSLLESYISGESSKELEDVWINSTMSHSQAFAAKYEGNPQDEELDLKKAVPIEFHEYLDVFSDEKSTRFPKSTPWDHKIELKEGFQPKSSKIYPLTPEEDKMTKEFIDDNLKKGFIRPSKSPMASPFFFVDKKGTAKKRPFKTTVISMIGPSRMPTPYHLSLISWTRSRTPNTLPKWMYD